ncbi:MAG: hypothetical protein ACI9P5_001700 [Saprospiraceae bacterium]|jgi:hypothetical protein
MKNFFAKKTNIGFTIFAAVILFAFSGSHPTSSTGGYTGAPNDNVCTTCHTPGGSLDGTIEISGLPSTVTPNDTYPLTVTITNTAGSAVRAGFQMVSLKANLANGGTFSVPATETNEQVKTAAGKSYIGHQPAKNFSANIVTYNVNWTAPASATGNITVYGASMIGNGANGNSNDKFVATNVSTVLASGGDPLTATFPFDAPTSCSDSNDGSATVLAMGGSGGYTYMWDNGETAETAIMLSAGNHDVTVTDDSNTSITESIFIDSPNPIILNIITESDAICNGENTGMGEVNASGGNGGFTYDWGNGLTGALQNNLTAGTYTVSATDVNDCQETVIVSIGEPLPIVINIINLTMPSCSNESDGSISVEATGGNGGFSYSWLTGMGITNEGTITEIPAGTYTVEVFDIEGCNNEITITLGEPTPLDFSITAIDANCFGGADGSATASSTGGTGPYTYAWSNGGSGATQTNLTAGTYTVTATDGNDCTIVGSVDISEPPTALTAGIVVTTQPNCGNADGTLSAFGDGGTPEYTYLWNNESTNAVLTNIAAGDYSVTTTDSNGCTAEAAVTLTENEGISLAANDVINNNCNGGSIGAATITADGGVGTYTYLWSNGGTNETETGLDAGSYSITVTDIGSCTGVITIEITEPQPFLANETIVHISCDGAEDGSITLAASGGTGALSYAWSIGSTEATISNLVPGQYSATISDALDCFGEFQFVIQEPDPIVIDIVSTMVPNCPGDSTGIIIIEASGGIGAFTYLWNNGDTTATISNLEEGDYSISVTDANECISEASFTLDDPSEIEVTATETMPSCFDSTDGSIAVSASGGAGGFTYLWENGNTTESLENIPIGDYNVEVTDMNNCSKSFIFTLSGPLEIEANINTMDVSENGAMDGMAIADPQNGVGPYTYDWSNGATTASVGGLDPGVYTLIISDANGCTIEVTVVINNGDCNISSTTIISNISCADAQDGSILVMLEGAVEPITYEWSNGSTSSSIDSLGVGLYSVTTTDANGCLLQIVDIGITSPEELSVENIQITDASSSESQDGSINFDIIGGTGAISVVYTDAFGQPNGLDNFEDLLPGIYGVILTDENGCIKFFAPFEVGVISSVSEVSINVVLYPNPASNLITIEIDKNQKLNNLPSIYDLNGRKVNASATHINNRYLLDVSNLHDGLYYVKLESKDQVKLLKVLVAKI